jgi:hypothetical protein
MDIKKIKEHAATLRAVLNDCKAKLGTLPAEAEEAIAALESMGEKAKSTKEA